MRQLVFSNVIKPTHVCNLACTYCYNDDLREPMMREGTLLRTIEQTFSYVRSKSASLAEAHFIWHGGEPMAVGLGFYERAMAMQRELSQGVRYSNAIQTNGVPINSRWIDFFLEHRFSVGVSIDGPQHVHDQHRLTHQGKGSFEAVARKIQRARDAGLPVGLTLVLSRFSLQYLDEIFDFFKELGLPMEVIPMNRSGGARDGYDELGLDAEDYGNAWKAMYDKWLALPKSGYFPVQDFISRTRAVIYGVSTSCHTSASCSLNNISTDPVGDVYACSSLSGTPEMKYGNLCEESLEELLASAVASEMKNAAVDPHCASCKWQHTCHGGCVARSYKFNGTVHKRDYYCPSLYAIYEHIETKLREQRLAPGARNPLHLTEGLEPGVIKELQTPLKGRGIAINIPILAI